MGDDVLSVPEWLRIISLSQYQEKFLQYGFDDLETVADLTEEDLDGVGVSKPGHRKKLLKQSQSLRQRLDDQGLSDVEKELELRVEKHVRSPSKSKSASTSSSKEDSTKGRDSLSSSKRKKDSGSRPSRKSKGGERKKAGTPRGDRRKKDGTPRGDRRKKDGTPRGERRKKGGTASPRSRKSSPRSLAHSCNEKSATMRASSKKGSGLSNSQTSLSGGSSELPRSSSKSESKPKKKKKKKASNGGGGGGGGGANASAAPHKAANHSTTEKLRNTIFAEKEDDKPSSIIRAARKSRSGVVSNEPDEFLYPEAHKEWKQKRVESMMNALPISNASKKNKAPPDEFLHPEEYARWKKDIAMHTMSSAGINPAVDEASLLSEARQRRRRDPRHPQADSLGSFPSAHHSRVDGGGGGDGIATNSGGGGDRGNKVTGLVDEEFQRMPVMEPVYASSMLVDAADGSPPPSQASQRHTPSQKDRSPPPSSTTSPSPSQAGYSSSKRGGGNVTGLVEERYQSLPNMEPVYAPLSSSGSSRHHHGGGGGGGGGKRVTSWGSSAPKASLKDRIRHASSASLTSSDGPLSPRRGSLASPEITHASRHGSQKFVPVFRRAPSQRNTRLHASPAQAHSFATLPKPIPSAMDRRSSSPSQHQRVGGTMTPDRHPAVRRYGAKAVGGASGENRPHSHVRSSAMMQRSLSFSTHTMSYTSKRSPLDKRTSIGRVSRRPISRDRRSPYHQRHQHQHASMSASADPEGAHQPIMMGSSPSSALEDSHSMDGSSDGEYFFPGEMAWRAKSGSGISSVSGGSGIERKSGGSGIERILDRTRALDALDESASPPPSSSPSHVYGGGASLASSSSSSSIAAVGRVASDGGGYASGMMDELGAGGGDSPFNASLVHHRIALQRRGSTDSGYGSSDSSEFNHRSSSRSGTSFEVQRIQWSYRPLRVEDLEMNQQVGVGTLGSTMKGTWKGATVAIRRIALPDSKEASSVALELNYEAQLMSKMAPHPNVLRLVGVGKSGPSLYFVTEYMPLGSLYDLFIKDHNELTWSLLVGLCWDAACGLLHLHSQGIIHRDIAARNILVDSLWTAKVSDFGMARLKMICDDAGKTHSTSGPLRWMAPEALLRQEYSTSSDVYSFGVMLWEVASRGHPYADISNNRVIKHVLDGGRPELEEVVSRGCPAALRDLMVECWAEDPSRRPSCADLASRLEALYHSLHHRRRDDGDDDDDDAVDVDGGVMGLGAHSVAVPRDPSSSASSSSAASSWASRRASRAAASMARVQRDPLERARRRMGPVAQLEEIGAALGPADPRRAELDAFSRLSRAFVAAYAPEERRYLFVDDGLRTPFACPGVVESLLRWLRDRNAVKDVVRMLATLCCVPRNAAVVVDEAREHVALAAVLHYARSVVDDPEAQRHIVAVLGGCTRLRATIEMVRHAVKVLDRHRESEALQAATLRAVAAISETDAGAKLLVRCNAVELVMDTLYKHAQSPRVATHALHVVRNLAKDYSTCCLLAKRHALDMVLGSIRAHAFLPSVVTAACRAVGALTHELDMKLRAFRANAPHVMMEAAKQLNTYPAIAASICFALRRLSATFSKADNERAISFILELVRVHHSHIPTQCEALHALHYIAADLDGRRALLKARGSLEYVFSTMKSISWNRKVQSMCCDLVASLSGDERAMRLLMKKNVFKLIFHAMEEHHSDTLVLSSCCAAIAKMCTYAENRVEFRKARGIHKIIALITENLVDACVVEDACVALGHLALDAPYRGEIARRGGIDIVLRALETHEQNRYVQEMGCCALRNLLVSEANWKYFTEKDALTLQRARERFPTSLMKDNVDFLLNTFAQHKDDEASSSRASTVDGIPLLTPLSPSALEESSFGYTSEEPSMDEA